MFETTPYAIDFTSHLVDQDWVTKKKSISVLSSMCVFAITIFII